MSAAALHINRENAWVRLSCGDLRLLIPQTQISMVETLAAITIMPEDNVAEELRSQQPNAAGWISNDDYTAPVFCCSARLQLLNNIPKNYPYIALLHGDSGLLGLACDSIHTYGAGNTNIVQALPKCMLLPAAMFRSYSVIAGELFLIPELHVLEQLCLGDTHSLNDADHVTL